MSTYFVLEVLRKIYSNIVFCLILFVMSISTIGWAGQWSVQMHAYKGSTPEIDGIISHGGIGKKYIFSTSNSIFAGMPPESYRIMLDEYNFCCERNSS